MTNDIAVELVFERRSCKRTNDCALCEPLLKIKDSSEHTVTQTELGTEHAHDAKDAVACGDSACIIASSPSRFESLLVRKYVDTSSTYFYLCRRYVCT